MYKLRLYYYRFVYEPKYMITHPEQYYGRRMAIRFALAWVSQMWAQTLYEWKLAGWQYE